MKELTGKQEFTEEEINEEIIKEFVQINVLANVTMFITDILKNGKCFDEQDIDNYFPDNSNEIAELENLDYDTLSFQEQIENDKRLQQLYLEEGYGKDIEEWLLVTAPLAEALYIRGEACIIIKDEELYVWGRETSSKYDPVEDDDVILDICTDGEILSGMKNSWEFKK